MNNKTDLKEGLQGNYLSFLADIKDDFDEVIKKMRYQRDEAWFKKAVSGPIISGAKNLRHFRLVKLIPASVITGIVGGMSWISYKIQPLMPTWIWIILIVVMIIALYTLCVWLYMGKMATIGHPSFHAQVFKMRRPKEYDLWKQFVNKDDFTFKGLYDFVQVSFNDSADAASIISLTNLTQGTITEKQAQIIGLEQTIDDLTSTRSVLEKDLEEAENVITYLTDIIKKVNENLFRLNNGRLALTDLDFVPGYSIYEIQEDKLIFIEDKGTSGNSPSSIDMNDPANQEMLIVRVAYSENHQVLLDNPYPGRNLVSFKMKMAIDKYWVWCFHIEDTDERSLSLVQNNAIIYARDIHRLVHAFCLLVENKRLSKEEIT